MNLDRPVVLVWLGTCEFTEKRGRNIYLREKKSVADVLTRLQALKANIFKTEFFNRSYIFKMSYLFNSS